jgi:hypothetical protein
MKIDRLRVNLTQKAGALQERETIKKSPPPNGSSSSYNPVNQKRRH